MSLILYKRPFSRSYENEFFRDFSRSLQLLFDRKGWNGILIGSPHIDSQPTLQIDALLISEQHVCIIDFKNFGGEIELPKEQEDFERKAWYTSNGERVKGGSTINPFKQLQKQSIKLEDVIDNVANPILADGDKIHPWQVKRIVCFQKETTFLGSVPPKREMTFFLCDVSTAISKIEDILDIEGSETKLGTESLRKLISVFQAPEYDVDVDKSEASVDETELFPIVEVDEISKFESLKNDQKEVLEKIKEFLTISTQRVFQIHGTSGSGKTFLIPFIKEMAFESGVLEVEMLASSSKVADVISQQTNEMFTSIYRFVFDRTLVKVDDTEEESIKLGLKGYYPVKQNDTSENTLFLIDEGHLINDGYMQMDDLRFGSGHLLNDLIDFADLSGSQRKFVVLGDLNIVGNHRKESLLQAGYLLDHYEVETIGFKLDHNKLGKPIYSIIGNSIELSKSIEKGLFNSLSIDSSEEISIIKGEEAAKNTILQLKENFWDFKLLTYPNKQALEINYWIKENYLKNGSTLSTGDLLIFHKGLFIKNEDPFIADHYFKNGDIVKVISLEEPFDSKPQPLKGRDKPIQFIFQYITVTDQFESKKFRIPIIIDYLERDKPDLQKDELLALKILFESDVKEEAGKRKIVDEEAKKELRLELAKTSIYTNYALVRYGWAMTVEKTVPYKFDKVSLSCGYKQDNRGAANESYFTWLYTALTRAKKEVFVIDCPNFNCYRDVVFKIGEPLTTLDPPEKRVTYDGLSELKDTELAFAGKFNIDSNKIELVRHSMDIARRLQNCDLQIQKIEQKPWLEIYIVGDGTKVIGTLKTYYNGKYQFKDPIFENVSKDIELKIVDSLSKTHAIESIEPAWKRMAYCILKEKLDMEGISLSQLDSKDDKMDRLHLSKDNELLVVDIYYSRSEGFFSSIIHRGTTNEHIWNRFESIIANLK